MSSDENLVIIPLIDQHNDSTGQFANNSFLSAAYNSTPDMAALSAEDYASILRFQYYAWSVLGTIIAVLGLLGNIISIPVLANRRMMSPTSCYLIALAVFDSLVLISLVLSMSLPVVHLKTGRLRGYYAAYPYLQPVAYPLALTAQTCSIYTTVAFTVERYIAVCHPLKAGKWCSMSRARKGVIFTVLSSIIYNVPRMLELKVAYETGADNSTHAVTAYTTLGENRTFRYVYFICLHIVVMLLIPFVVLLVLNALLIRAVRQSAHVEGKVTNRQRRENNLTVMLSAVVAVFLASQVLSIVDNIFMATMPEDKLRSPPFVKFTCVSSLMVVTNSAINFYLYCVFGKKFRYVFLWFFCSCFERLTKRLNLMPRRMETTVYMSNSLKHSITHVPAKQRTPLLALQKSRLRTSACEEDGDKNLLTPHVRKYMMITNATNGEISDETSV